MAKNALIKLVEHLTPNARPYVFNNLYKNKVGYFYSFQTKEWIEKYKTAYNLK